MDDHGNESRNLAPPDEIIADSEEEEAFPVRIAVRNNKVPQTSPVSAFAIANPHQQASRSSIFNFTAGPSALPDYPSTFASKERGHAKEADAETSIASITGAYTHFDAISSSIADRAKTRQRPSKPNISSEIIELTTDDEGYDPKASTSKAKAKPKAKVKPKAKSNDAEKEKGSPPTAVIPDNSMQVDPPREPAPPRPRPRPRPKVPVPAVAIRDSVAPFPSASTSPGPELPIATSPSRVPAHPLPSSSMLPPSDPPVPTPSTAYNDVPPIDCLSPPSSPNSLFNEGTPSRKRKRGASELDEEVDELASEALPGLGSPVYGYQPPPRGTPPPTFFAGSSSSSGRDRGAAHTSGLDPLTDASVPVLVPESVPQRDVVDLTMLPPTMVPPPKPKAKKSKKADLSMYDGSAGDKMIVLDEDDQDGDFDPAGEGSSKKKKGKAKDKDKEKPTKAKAKGKAKGSSDLTGKSKVEVVLTARPQSKGNVKGKETPKADKGKQKADTNKEAFKSSEFIEDSEDELGFSGAPSVGAGAAPKAAIQMPAAKPASPVPTTSASSKKHRQSPQRSPSPLTECDSDVPKAGPSTSKRASGSAKKRKSIVDSEAENGGYQVTEAQDVIHVNPSVSSKKRKTDTLAGNDAGKSKAKSKSKKVVLSDDEMDGVDEAHEMVVVKPKGSLKAAKVSKKAIHDGEDEAVNEPSKSTPPIRNQETTAAGDTPLPKASKENIVPAPAKPAPAYSTPRPSAQPKATPVGTGDKTPLYARYEIAPRRSSLPMSELIRRANSMPGSPFAPPATPAAASSGSAAKGTPLARARAPGLAYSPLLKSSRSVLSRIASLHPNRRTPPPPPPPPPPRKKSKKELELEEKWEEEMVEAAGGVEAWAVLGDEERREMRKAKWARELGGWEE